VDTSQCCHLRWALCAVNHRPHESADADAAWQGHTWRAVAHAPFGGARASPSDRSERTRTQGHVPRPAETKRDRGNRTVPRDRSAATTKRPDDRGQHRTHSLT
jgi:hypothetical protein